MKRPKPRRSKGKRGAGDIFLAAMERETEREQAAAISELRKTISRTLELVYGEDCEASIYVFHELIRNPNGARCMECGVVAGHVMTFIPNSRRCAKDLKLPDGEKALILYPLCPACASRVKASSADIDALENRLIQDLVRREMVEGDNPC